MIKRSTIAVLCLLFAQALGQSNSAELRLKVVDPAGVALQSSVELVCEANQYHQLTHTDDSGNLVFRNLPFGLYKVQVSSPGFATYSSALQVRSAISPRLLVTLSVAALETKVDVTDSDTLIDHYRTGTPNRIGQETIQHQTVALPGRSVIALVSSQPGWVLESNGTLHPRGSEYQTQYVVNGVPLTDNRSPAFAPEIESDDIESLTVLTANYPAEYGRKLGGVVEISTVKDSQPGFHGAASISGGSFATAATNLSAQYAWGKNALALNADGGVTDRYLDPPVPQNYTNHGTTGDLGAHYERDFANGDRLGLMLRHGRAGFQVPNEYMQEAAGQRQDRSSEETMGIFSYQRVFSSDVLGDIRAMGRDNSVSLASNLFSTPIIAGQQRGFREAYFKATLSAHYGIHEFKAGSEISYGSLHERFDYAITGSSQFDPGTPVTFRFAGAALDREQSVFAQDLLRLGPWTLSAGLRWDHYALLVDKSAVSPRLGIARYWQSADLVVHASYDRVFQTPAAENLLLSSSPAVAVLNLQVLRLPIEPSMGNFYQVGMTKGFFGKIKLDASYYQRAFNNYADDDVLLNTGISFPIAFRKGKINGAEAKLEIPRWGRASGYLSYSYMAGFGYTPVTGGLFLGVDATTALANTGRFPVTQDQRNTISSRFRYQFTNRLWCAVGAYYGSGLPIEFDGTTQEAIQHYGQQVLHRVNFARGRVLPSLEFNASLGVDLLKAEKATLRLQVDGENLSNRLNLINFAGLFSGTGIAPPRSYAVRLGATF